MSAANSVWLPRPPLTVIQAGTSPLVYGWAPADIKSAIDALVPFVPGYFVNPMTARGDMIYASAAGAPATPARRAVGAVNQVLTSDGTDPTWANGSKATLGTTGDLLYASAPNTLAALAAGTSGYFLRSNGPGVAPSYAAVTGPDALTGRASAAWGWAGPGSSGTTVAVTGTLGAVTPTATDASSASAIDSGAAYDQGWPSFRQNTSGVANNTTVLSWISGASVSVPMVWAATTANSASALIFVYTFKFGSTGQPYFAFNFGNGTAAASATATEDVRSCGISYLSGDASVYAFNRGTGGSSRTILNWVPVLDEPYTLALITTPDGLGSGAHAFRVAVYRHSTLSWVADSSNLALNTAGNLGVGRIVLYAETPAASARSIYHYGLQVDATKPLVLP